MDRTVRIVDQLPEDYREYRDETHLFILDPKGLKLNPKDEKGVKYLGDKYSVSVGLLRLLGRTIKDGIIGKFLIIAEDRVYKDLVYVKLPFF